MTYKESWLTKAALRINAMHWSLKAIVSVLFPPFALIWWAFSSHAKQHIINSHRIHTTLQRLNQESITLYAERKHLIDTIKSLEKDVNMFKQCGEMAKVRLLSAEAKIKDQELPHAPTINDLN